MKNLINVSDDLQFHLCNSRISYLFRVSDEGILEHIYFGDAIQADALAAGSRRAFRCTSLEFEGVKDYNLSDIPQEFPQFGRSDQRRPAIHVVNGKGNTTSSLLYESHQSITEKPALAGLPSARGNHSETLVVTLADELTGLTVVLCYTIYERHDVVARSARVLNRGERALRLKAVASSCLDLPPGDYELLHFTGTWSREFNTQRTQVGPGFFDVSSASGTSSNVHSPFTALMEKGADEEAGRVWANALVYSGNFSVGVEQGEFEAVRVTTGINPFNFEWLLEPGETFQTPESLQVYTRHGLDAMSQIWHQFVRAQISPPQFVDEPRPTYLNSWESAYFDLSEDLILTLAITAQKLGLEMLVVDDGWFRGRNDDTSSLGDWTSDKDKFPDGIEAAAAKVKGMGLKFGLWFEPEMVNEDSDLYRDHPDWIIHVPGRKPSTGRQQLTLDLSRDEVVDYLFERLDHFLGSGQIDYVKWDMNRVMTEIGSAGLAAERQQETAHRYMLGLYRLLERVVSKYPNVLFENCASGGNRFDLGMLCYMSQGWVSDMSEPMGRLPIVTGASYLFPQNVLASYIGPVPSHQNDRRVSLQTRADVGFFCAARGLSLNQLDLASDADHLKEIIATYRDTAEDLTQGSFHRLRATPNETCWQLSSRDKRRVYLGYFHVLSAPNLPYRRIRLRGLDAQARYREIGTDNVYAGSALMHMGMDMPYVHALQLSEGERYMPRGDFSSWVCRLEKV